MRWRRQRQRDLAATRYGRCNRHGALQSPFSSSSRCLSAEPARSAFGMLSSPLSRIALCAFSWRILRSSGLLYIKIESASPKQAASEPHDVDLVDGRW